MNKKALSKLRQWLRDSEAIELLDILEPVTAPTFKHIIAENIDYVLERAGIKGLSVVLPEGSYDYQIGDESTKFVGEFMLFSDPQTSIATGSVIGDGVGEELLSITLTITSVKDEERPENALHFF